MQIYDQTTFVSLYLNLVDKVIEIKIDNLYEIYKETSLYFERIKWVYENYYLLFLKQFDPLSESKFSVIGDLLVKKNITLVKLKKLIKKAWIDAMKCNNDYLLNSKPKKKIRVPKTTRKNKNKKKNRRGSLIEETECSQLYQLKHSIIHKRKVVVFNESLITK